MENKGKFFSDSAKVNKIIGAVLIALLLIFEGIIIAQYCYITPRPPLWGKISLVGCSFALDIQFLIDLYRVKTLQARVIIYGLDFVFLVFICALTGSTYIAALYCIFLTQLYLNVDRLRTKTIVFVGSCVLCDVTCIFGWLLNNRRAFTYSEIIDMGAACFVALIILAIHFCVANFIISFYRTNLKLTAALKESDERKKQLEEAYDQLSETAVFKERNRIARDIHDNAGHSMTAVIMQTEAAKLLVDTNPQAAKEKIVAANIQAKNALEQMRDSVHLLAGRDSAYSLKEEIEEILAQTMDGTDIKIRSDIQDFSLSGDRRRFIANSLKECLSNGMRHGGANAFYVELAEDGETVTLTVSDNGSGLPDDFKEGFGIRGIRERAAALGGGIVFSSESGDGCEINITIKEGKNDD